MIPDLGRLEALLDETAPDNWRERHDLVEAVITELRTARARLSALEQPGVTEANGTSAPVLTQGDISILKTHLTPPLMNYLGHAALGSLRPKELETMERMKCVSDKLDAMAALAPAPIAQGGERYRHVKRGTEYEVIGTAELQVATDIMGDTTIILYRGDDGKLWARQEDEFHDGRFVALQSPVDQPAAPVPDGMVCVPLEPPPGLLASMATCLDHGFGAPAQQIGDFTIGLTDEQKTQMLYDMAKLYAEVVGRGYYRPERAEFYQAMVPDQPPGAA